MNSEVTLSLVAQDDAYTIDSKEAAIGTTPNIRTLKVSVKAIKNPNVLSLRETIGEIEGINHLAKGTAVVVNPSSPLKAVGLESGDLISSVNGKKIERWTDLVKEISVTKPELPLSLEVQRIADEKGKLQSLSLNLKSGVVSRYSMEDLGLESTEVYLGKISEDSPAQAAGLAVGDKILKINNKPVLVWEDVLNSIRGWDGKNPVKMEIRRGSEVIVKEITPKESELQNQHGLEEKRFAIGIQPMLNAASADMISIKSEGLVSALVRGYKRTVDVTLMTAMSFVRLFEAKVSPKNIGGLISIGQAAHETFKLGLSQFLTMMAIISVNLFVLNLLPVPVLDGGHMVFYTIEVIKGSPLSIKKMEIAQQIGMILLMSLMVFALFNDFTRLFKS